jgi:class 3 adenylate cyclase
MSNERLEALERARPGARALIEPWIRDAEERELFRVCPLRWGQARGLPLDEGLDLLLHAVHAGLLRLGWELGCPGCGMQIRSVAELGAASDHPYCNLCLKDQQIALDDWIFATVTVRPEVRRIRHHDPESLTARERQLDCEPGIGVVMQDGEPLRQHIERNGVFAERLRPGESSSSRFEARPGLILVIPRQGIPIRGEPGGPTRLELVIDERGAAQPSSREVAPGPVELFVENRSAGALDVFAFQTAGGYRFGPPRGCTAAHVIHHPTYTSLFPPQLACAGGIAIRDVTLLFSDLVRSTAMYRQLGDLRAYERVREYFAALAPVVSSHNGIWVKDIGDAVMASFPEPEAAVRAALAMHDVVRRIGDLEVKVGLHCGPAIGVSFRGQLDWFGSTVNLAARVQSLAGPGELCVSDAVFRRARGPLANLPAEAFEARVRGIDEPIVTHRIAVRP